jgi:putative transposase
MIDSSLIKSAQAIMPARNTVKEYITDGYYHIYNRGVEKRLIFVDQKDYVVFLSYIADYLLPKDSEELLRLLSDPSTSYKQKDRLIKLLRLNNFHEDIQLIAFCLMPNHIHICIKQTKQNSMSKFMQSLMTRYTMYFNKKYNRVGPLFQAVYKATLLSSDEQLLYLTKYIHKQARSSQPSSYQDYSNIQNTSWIHPDEVLHFFSKNIPYLSYQQFVEEYADYKYFDQFSEDDTYFSSDLQNTNTREPALAFDLVDQVYASE